MKTIDDLVYILIFIALLSAQAYNHQYGPFLVTLLLDQVTTPGSLDPVSTEDAFTANFYSYLVPENAVDVLVGFVSLNPNCNLEMRVRTEGYPCTNSVNSPYSTQDGWVCSEGSPITVGTNVTSNLYRFRVGQVRFP